MNPPAFQFYPDDFIGGTVDLSAEEVGAYIRLLCYQWAKGAIPSTKPIVDRVAGCDVSEAVLAKFPGGRNVRLEAVRGNRLQWQEKSRLGGIRSGIARNQTGRVVEPPLEPPFEPNGQPKANTPTPTPTPIEKEKEGPNGKRTTIPTVEEVIAVGGMIGLGEQDCRSWHRDRAAEGWADANGVDIGNWRRWLTGYRDKLRSANLNGFKSAGSAIPASVQLVQASKELEEVQKTINALRPEGLNGLHGKERDRFNELVKRKKELKTVLGRL